MKLWWRLTLAVALVVGVWLGASALVGRAAAQTQMPAPAPGQKSGEFFKNVTTSTLKDLSVDDFIGSMGVIAAGLGVDCSDCHPGAGSDRVDWIIDPPRKKTARLMIEMVAAINRANFGGAQKVTCWTCHHGRITPATSIALDALYDVPNMENDDLVAPDPQQPAAEQVLDRYIQALGGAQRLAGLTSFVATGASVGYEALGGDAVFTIYAKAPNQRTTLITYKDHPERGESLWEFDGRTGWIKTPRALLQQYELVGGELDGARFEAQLAFPGQIKQALNNWRTGPRRSIGERDFIIVQGNGPRGFLATLYFDPQTGLLSRMVRYSPSPAGRVPTQVDYSDYRDVGGIKFPFELRFSWLDGRYTAKLTDIKTNVPIDASRFARPGAR
jgi:hypothetical protein